eukprot:TRINITY_DN9800_c0_g1_i1.p1 TRINITY_DN9800_c0_g1~~TRINITY_DN9800_c0_g1_i1.p1  ORF type:complete len:506 (+),score=156.98 TRINITY_DN9800_c0_g1_i1:84-1520(+)
MRPTQLQLLLLLLASAACLATAKHDMRAVHDRSLLADWMGVLRPVIENSTLLDVTLPGTHDSMTADLSQTVSDGANDIPPELAYFLHDFGNADGIGDFARNLSRTQVLKMTPHLDNGARFIDFRVMYSAPPDQLSSAPHDWYCLHLMQTYHPAMNYLEEARAWMDRHPDEVLVFWLSRHGNECGTEYPDVEPATMQQFWSRIEKLFSGLIFDHGKNSLNETTIASMLDTSQRAVFFVSDYANFTASSPLAIDGCQIDNELGDGISNEPAAVEELLRHFAAAGARKAADKRENKLYLMSMAASSPSDQIKYASLVRFDPLRKSAHEKKCAETFNIPGLTSWCPLHLQDISQLTNFYNQRVLDFAINASLHLPNAIYLDALDQGGVIRTGTALTGYPSAFDSSHEQSAFAYVDTLLLYNVRAACAAGNPPAADCEALTALFTARRALYPYENWDDPEHGRLSDWPSFNVSAVIGQREKAF